jgi:heat shock protein HslJ
MNKVKIMIIALVLTIAVLLSITIYKLNNKKDYVPLVNNINNQLNTEHDGTYTINGEKVTLVNGESVVEAAPGSASKITTRYFGNDVKYDFDKDGREDSVFIVTQDGGGSGTFYYVVARLNTINGPQGSYGLLLGDRIAPQSTLMGKGSIVVVNYADRKAGEDFTVEPSVGKSIWVLLDLNSMQFGEVAQNFEGEADPGRMTLNMKKWNWVNTLYSDDKIVKPATLNKFTLTFKDDKTFSASTDCNGVGGEYTVNGNKIAFTKMMSTQMFCEGSQEKDFTKMLTETDSYLFTSKGELVLNLKFDSGSVFFK